MRNATTFAALVTVPLLVLAGCGQEEPAPVPPATGTVTLTPAQPAPSKAKGEPGERGEPTPETDPDTPLYVIDVRFVRDGAGKDTTLTAPRLTVAPGQRANVSVVDQASFVQDYDTEYAHGAFIADPIIGVLQSGTTLEVLARPVAGKPGFASLAFDATVSQVRKPMREHTVTFHGDLQSGTVQLPVVDVQRSCGVRTVALDKPLLLATMPGAAPKDRVEIHVTLRAVGDMVSRRIVPEPDEPEEPDHPLLGEHEEEPVLGLDLVGTPADLPSMSIALGDGSQGAGRVRVELVTLDEVFDVDRLVDAKAALSVLKDMTVTPVATLLLEGGIVAGARTGTIVQTSYVQDYALPAPLEALLRAKKKLPDGPLAYHPIIGTFKTGIAVAVTAGEKGPDLRVSWGRSGGMPEHEAALERGPTVKIELPELLVVDRSTALKPGRWFLPLGTRIVRAKEGGEDRVAGAGAWIDYTPSR